MNLTDEQMNQYKEQILIDKMLGNIPSSRRNKATGVHRITIDHIKYIRGIVGSEQYAELDWYTRYDLIDCLTK